MIKTNKWLSVLMAAVFALCLCAGNAAAEADLSAYAGEYTFVCNVFSAAYMETAFDLAGKVQNIPDQCVAQPKWEDQTVTLNADGTGYLFWGEDNQGPIDRWTMDGDRLHFEAGISAFEGSIADGIMLVNFDEGLSACFALSAADTSEIEPLSLDAYLTMLLAMDEPEAAEAVEAEVYTLFAVESDGFVVNSEELEMESLLTLNADGSGHMTFDDESMDILEWTEDSGVISLTAADGFQVTAAIHDGVIEMDLYGTGETLFLYAAEGADISAYPLIGLLEYLESAYSEPAKDEPDSLLQSLWKSIDTDGPVHLKYDLNVEKTGVEQSHEVNCRKDVYSGRQKTANSDIITFIIDGMVYNLYPDKMTGIFVTPLASSDLQISLLMMDTLYADIAQLSSVKDFTTETREMNGVSYTAEVFPAAEYRPESAFYFDNAGKLAYYVKGAPILASGADLGESVFTIYAIDDEVDESALDASRYEILPQ